MLVEATEMKTSDKDLTGSFAELEKGVYTALKTYSNVERGSGHYSQVSTALLEKARLIVLDHQQLDKANYVVIFCTPYRTEIFKEQLRPGSYQIISSQDIGLPIGIRALVVKKNALPKGIPFETGGGMIKLVSSKSLVLADVPERFEAGTPGILNIIAFVIALQLKENFTIPDHNEKVGQAGTEIADQVLYQDDFIDYTGKDLLLQLRNTMPDNDLRVATTEGDRPYINLDNAASTPALLPVWDTVFQTLQQPAHIHKKIVSEAKTICTDFLGAPQNKYELIFSSNTTESLNIAAQNLARTFTHNKETVVLNTLMEHHSNELPWRYLPGVSLVRMPVDNDGFINPDELERILKEYNQDHIYGNKRILIVAVSGASNVLGSFNDIGKLARITHRYQAHILVDAAQMVAHHTISMEKDEIDYLAFSGHKIYAPFGSGALIIRKGLLNFTPQEMETFKASGEENIIGIAAIGKAMNLMQRIGMNVIRDEESRLTQKILNGLSTIKGVRVYGVQDTNSEQFKNKTGIVAFSMNNVPHNLTAKELAEEGGIGVRTGCFCAHLIVKRLMRIHPVRELLAEIFLKTITPNLTHVLPGIVRVSVGLENDEDDVDLLIHTLQKIAAKPRSFVTKFIATMYNGTLFLPRTTTQKQMEMFTEKTVKEVYS